jgi:hypothetical protein
MWRGLVSDPILQTLNDMGDAKERWWRAELCTDAMFARRLNVLSDDQADELCAFLGVLPDVAGRRLACVWEPGRVGA